MTGKTVGLAWYYEATVSGTDEQAAAFVSFPWPLPDSGSPNDSQATAEKFGTEFRHALHAEASPEEVAIFVAEALFDTAPLTAMIEQFDDRIERGPAPHAAVAQELIDGATTELNVGQTNARRFAEQRSTSRGSRSSSRWSLGRRFPSCSPSCQITQERFSAHGRGVLTTHHCCSSLWRRG